VALYLCTSTFLAMLLLAVYVSYAWDIDKERWYRAYAVLQGIEDDEAQAEIRKRVIESGFDSVITERARRSLTDEYQTVRQQVIDLPPPPSEEPPPPPPPVPNATEQIDAYAKRVQADLAKARTEGLDEQTRLIENMDPEQAKEVIRKLWKDGMKDRVLTMLLNMTDKRRGEILYTMQQDNAEELKDLCEILQDIGDGKPMSSIIQKAAQEPQ
jgi:nuclear transport factor 2 (NTF2) superfamily protein